MPGKHYYFIVTILLFRVKSLCQNMSVVLVCVWKGVKMVFECCSCCCCKIFSCIVHRYRDDYTKILIADFTMTLKNVVLFFY